MSEIDQKKEPIKGRLEEIEAGEAEKIVGGTGGPVDPSDPNVPEGIGEGRSDDSPPPPGSD